MSFFRNDGSERNLDEQLTQLATCRRFGVEPSPAPLDFKVGISLNVREGIQPLNGLRCSPANGTTGWYIWAGEWSDDPDFFKPLHVSHLSEWCPQAVPYLQLPPGWRFLVAPDVEDAWHDPDLEL